MPPADGPGAGPVAASRAVSHSLGGQASAAELAQHIRQQDALLVDRGALALHYLPVSVGGLDLKLEPLAPSIGTVVHGISLADPLEPEVVDFLRQLWLDRRVLFFRGQSLDRQQHAAVATLFGEQGGVFGERGVGADNEAGLARFYRGEEGGPGTGAASSWHSDATWAEKPPMGSLLLCHEAPPVGGDTLFCDAYAMWAALGPALQAELAPLSAVHAGEGFHGGPPDFKAPEAVHPVARTHPETGGTTLFFNPQMTKRFLGVSEEDSARLWGACDAVVGRAEYCCRFRWEAGSLALWDNRACQHYAVPDFWPHTRRMERVVVVDGQDERKAPFFRLGQEARM
eukprot:COSAG04_NODE_1286_length_7373_cov_44.163046_2_plen_342_part_00